MRNLPILLLLASGVVGQTDGLKFDAVSIHELEAPYRALGMLTVSGSLVKMEGYAVPMLVAAAYGKKNYEVSAPPPKHFAYFRVEARAPGDATPTPAVLQAMLQNMLAERFHLTAHVEKRSVPVYALVVSKGGPKLKAGSGDQDCRQVTGPVNPADRNYRHLLQNCSIDRFVSVLGADRPVLNRTELAGLYDISIFYTPDFRMQNQIEPTDISILDSVRQLGLQLEPRNEQMDVVVVDRYDDIPSAN